MMVFFIDFIIKELSNSFYTTQKLFPKLSTGISVDFQILVNRNGIFLCNYQPQLITCQIPKKGQAIFNVVTCQMGTSHEFPQTVATTFVIVSFYAYYPQCISNSFCSSSLPSSYKKIPECFWERSLTVMVSIHKAYSHVIFALVHLKEISSLQLVYNGQTE